MKTYLDDLKSLVDSMKKEKIIDKLMEIVPGYKPQFTMNVDEQLSIQNTETAKQVQILRSS